MDVLVVLVGFALGYLTVWYIYNRRLNQRPTIEPPLKIQLYLAGNYQQYRYHVERNVPDYRQKTRYISKVEDIRGYHGNSSELHLIGTYRENKDYEQILQYAAMHEIPVTQP